MDGNEELRKEIPKVSEGIREVRELGSEDQSEGGPGKG